MLSASPLAMADSDESFQSENSEQTGNDGGEENGLQNNQITQSQIRLIIVDPAVEDYQELIDSIANDEDPNIFTKIELLSADRSGIEQINETIGSLSNIESIHLFSHGDQARIKLGNAWFGFNDLQAYSGQLVGWRDHLTADADFLIYGCDLAGSDEGKLFVESLSELTQADVAASDDLTGHQSLGGDWDLEFSVGQIDSAIVVTESVQSNWRSLLAASSGGTAIWRENGVTTLQTSQWDGTAFGVETNTTDVDDWRIIQGARSSTRDEIIVLGIGDHSKVVSGQIWNGSSWSEIPLNPLGSVSKSDWWGVDVAYESQTGDAVLAWTDGAQIEYTKWNGSTWSAVSTLSLYSSSTPRQIQLVANPNSSSNEMVLVVSDVNNRDTAYVWNGTSWSNSTLLSTGSGDKNTDIQVAYEQQSGHAIVVYGTNSNSPSYVVWNGSAWGSATSISAPSGVTGNARWTMLASDPTSDRLVLGVTTDNKQGWVSIWNGDSWTSTTTVSSSINVNDAPNLAVAFESQSGTAIVTYGENNNHFKYRFLLAGSWSLEFSGPDLKGKLNSMTLTADPASNHLMLAVQDSKQDLHYVLWDGLFEGQSPSWISSTELETQTGETKRQPFLFLWNNAANIGPTAHAGGAYVINEGDSLTLNATASTASGTIALYEWDLDNDGIFQEVGEPTVVNSTLTWANLQSFGINDGNIVGTDYTIGLRVTDNLGATNTTTTTVKVKNVAPTISLSGSGSAQVNTATTLNLTATDPGNDTLSNWRIDWGDGISETLVGSATSATHTYTVAGLTHNILVSATDEDGTWFTSDLFVATDSANPVYRFDGMSGAFESTSGSNSTLNSGTTIVTGPDGLLYVSGLLSNNVQRFNPITNAFVDTFVTSGSGGLNGASNLAFGRDGNLYVGDNSNHRILRYNGTTGAFMDVFVSAGSGGLNQPIGIAFGPDGNLYVASSASNSILRFNGTTGAMIDEFVTAGSGGLDDPTRFTFGQNGDLFVASFGSNNILRFNGTSGTFINAFVSAGSGGLSQPEDVWFGPDGNLYVSSSSDHSVKKYDGTTGNFLDNLVSSSANGLHNPFAFSFSANHQIKVMSAPVVNTPPTDIDQTSFNVDENTDTTSGHNLGILTSVDPDSGETFTYSIQAGADRSRFAIGGLDNDRLILTDGVLNYENKSSYTANVRVSDSAGNTFDKTLTVSVNNLNEVPTDITPNSFSVNENRDTSGGLNLGELSAVDPDNGETFIYTILPGADAAQFNLSGPSNNRLTLTDGMLDFETKSSYTVNVRVTDSASNIYDETLAINVNNLNEDPTDILFGSIGIDEQTDTSSGFDLRQLTAVDPDSGETFTFTILAGADATRFVIGGAGSDRLILNDGILDFETQPSYTANVRVTDPVGNTYDEALTITVNNLNDAPTLTLTNVVNELLEETDTSSAILVANIVIDDDTLGTATLSLSGVDAGFFEIAGFELRLRAGTVLDVDIQNTYTVIVQVSDISLGGVTDSISHTLTITETIVALPPVVIQPTKTNEPEAQPDSSENEEAEILGTNFLQNPNGNNSAVPDNNQLISNTRSTTNSTADGTDSDSMKKAFATTEEEDNLHFISKNNFRSNNGSLSNTQTHRFTATSLASLSQPGLLWNELDQFKYSETNGISFDSMTIGTVGTVTSGMIVGYVVWTLRSGILLSSMMAAMPAWNLFDPLAIVSLEDNESEEDQESLEEIIESEKLKLKTTETETENN